MIPELIIYRVLKTAESGHLNDFIPLPDYPECVIVKQIANFGGDGEWLSDEERVEFEDIIGMYIGEISREHNCKLPLSNVVIEQIFKRFKSFFKPEEVIDTKKYSYYAFY